MKFQVFKNIYTLGPVAQAYSSRHLGARGQEDGKLETCLNYKVFEVKLGLAVRSASKQT